MSRVLLTGASSFTGAWLTEALYELGAQIVAPLAGSTDSQSGHWLRQARMAKIADYCVWQGDSPFGSPRFFDLLDSHGPFDLVILHGAQVGEFRHGNFDVPAAVAANTRNLQPVLDRLVQTGCNRLVVTGSVFEASEGMSDTPLDPIGAYGLAKSLTWLAIEDAALDRQMAIGKFVIPHPFGALEKTGLVSHLINAWLEGRPGIVNHPQLARDLVHVDQLAQAYARFALALPTQAGVFRRAPSGYRETLGDFAGRLARAMRPRLGRPCLVDSSKPQRLVGEPIVRQNTDIAFGDDSVWNYAKSWDLLAEFYGCGQICALSKSVELINL